MSRPTRGKTPALKKVGAKLNSEEMSIFKKLLKLSGFNTEAEYIRYRVLSENVAVGDGTGELDD